MSILAVIPARGGSKGIPRKNIRDLGGKPMIAWTIEQALAVPDLRVAVSTEDEEITSVAREYGAWVIERPDELAQDLTPTEPVVLHAIEACTEEFERPEAVMLLQATSPVRRPGTLARAVEEFRSSGKDALVGVVPCPPFIWSTVGGTAKAHWDWENRLRRQDMTEADLRYRETGSVYVTKTEIYERLNNRMGGDIGLFIMDDDEGIDIDTTFDFDLAADTLARFAK